MVPIHDVRTRHRLTCPDHADQAYAEQAHADVLELLDLVSVMQSKIVRLGDAWEMVKDSQPDTAEFDELEDAVMSLLTMKGVAR